MAERKPIHIGTSGWSYEHWRGAFYEQRGRSADYLAAYARVFKTAEVNNSFYRIPEKKTIRLWRDTVPNDFIFSVKSSRFLTHMKKLKDPQDPLDRLMEPIAEFGHKLGPILVQLPPNWRKNPERLAGFLEILPEDHRFAFEFRDWSWFEGDIYDLLRQHRAALCIYDQEFATSPIELTADWTYIRFHAPGTPGWHYPRDELAGWADRIVEWAESGNTVYCYFNNDLDAAAPRNAMELRELVDERSSG